MRFIVLSHLLPSSFSVTTTSMTCQKASPFTFLPSLVIWPIEMPAISPSAWRKTQTCRWHRCRETKQTARVSIGCEAVESQEGLRRAGRLSSPGNTRSPGTQSGRGLFLIKDSQLEDLPQELLLFVLHDKLFGTRFFPFQHNKGILRGVGVIRVCSCRGNFIF